jgi:hypothetical protein
MNASSTPSLSLLEANRRLYELRAQAQAERRLNVKPCSVPRGSYAGQNGAENGSPNPDDPAQLPDLPPHLGWESEAFTAVLRTAQERRRAAAGGSETESVTWRPELHLITGATAAAPAKPEFNPQTDSIKLYHDIALGMLRQEQAAAGRLWLLLRYLDDQGQGWIAVDRARVMLTGQASPLRVCGRRQLRNLLCQGEGTFWQRDAERIWLRSAAQVAAALDVARLSGRPVALPVRVLLAGIGEVKAHLFASFHSGRRSRNPINRHTLERVTGVPARTQSGYEKIAGVAGHCNFAVGERYALEMAQERGWRHGRATFVFVDHQGFQGETKRRYVAWRLPNSYAGGHEPCPRGRQKKINRKLKDLVMKRAQGNSSGEVSRLFHSDGAAAARTHSRRGDTDHYWPGNPAAQRSARLWNVIGQCR